MSRIGKKPIEIPAGVTVTVSGQVVKVKGALGELQTTVHPNISVKMENNILEVKRPDDLKENRALHGLTRALIQNMIKGVSEGYKKVLDIVGVGYKAELKGTNLLVTIGYSHPIYFIPPAGIKLETPTPTQIIISGIDKQLVGQVASKIRSFRKPEPYKGKGIKYSDEQILRKAGKTAGK
ncbi:MULTISPECIES: 50S ribosomal protein L6 [Ignavibacterium]|uniref:50S ribosomal protein L6 n=1 Tax=Ignavibacterium TaxID=795750 RepID=UPI0025BE61DB|nr:MULTISPECIES: 50S ribosomal protein L6 [Ignavibacterium]MBI5661599.1 50S ribosomal protein L6 [Ignavibacterium album]